MKTYWGLGLQAWERVECVWLRFAAFGVGELTEALRTSEYTLLFPDALSCAAALTR